MIVHSVSGGCKLDPKFAVQSNTPKVFALTEMFLVESKTNPNSQTYKKCCPKFVHTWSGYVRVQRPAVVRLVGDGWAGLVLLGRGRGRCGRAVLRGRGVRGPVLRPRLLPVDLDGLNGELDVALAVMPPGGVFRWGCVVETRLGSVGHGGYEAVLLPPVPHRAVTLPGQKGHLQEEEEGSQVLDIHV